MPNIMGDFPWPITFAVFWTCINSLFLLYNTDKMSKKYERADPICLDMLSLFEHGGLIDEENA